MPHSAPTISKNNFLRKGSHINFEPFGVLGGVILSILGYRKGGYNANNLLYWAIWGVGCGEPSGDKPLNKCTLPYFMEKVKQGRISYFFFLLQVTVTPRIAPRGARGHVPSRHTMVRRTPSMQAMARHAIGYTASYGSLFLKIIMFSR